MKKITVIAPTSKPISKKQRVAAYARVSMETERLMHSLSSQVSYYSELIQSNPDWEYAGVYADKFLSATGGVRRPEFERLIQDCMDGKIDIVLCKSISRFARNTVDLLQTVRQLKSKGIDVRFEKENINTLSESGEIMLSLLASFAQEESMSISENCKWGIRKKFADGTKKPTQKRLFGYQYDGEKFVVVPKEADVVRYMFNRYLEGAGYRTIAKEVTEMGIKSVRGYDFKEEAPIRGILTNEIYVGDILFQKYYITEPITKHVVRNRGELPQYLIRDCHEPIVSRELFEAVQQEIRRKAEIASRSALSHKIKCGVCGRYYTHKRCKNNGTIYYSWFCRAKKGGGKCSSRYLREPRLKRIIAHYLDIPTFDDSVFEHNIREITALEDRSLIFYFKDGTVKEWRNLTDGPYDCKDLSACFRGKLKCSCCGTFYSRRKDNNNHASWNCMGVWRNATKDLIHSINYNESDLARICAYVLGMNELDEEEFKTQVQEIIVHENGDLLFRLKDGSEKYWERML